MADFREADKQFAADLDVPSYRMKSIVLLNLTVLVACGTPALAQGGGNACPTCLTVTPSVELSSEPGIFVPSTIQSILRTEDGRFLVTQLYGSTVTIAVYDAAGRFVSEVGRRGEGPGEFEHYPRLFVGSGSTIWAYYGNRMVIFDRDIQHLETRTLSRALGQRAYFVPPSTIVTDARTTEKNGSVHMVALLDSAGAASVLLEPALDPVESVVVAPIHFGRGFWALKGNGSELRRYSADGALLTTLNLQIAGFQPFDTALPGEKREGYDVPSRPRHKELIDLGDDLVVITTTVASSEWEPSSGQALDFEGTDHNIASDTRITLLDLRTGQTIASQDVPEMMWWSVHGTHDQIYSSRLDPNGHVITTIWQIAGRRPPP